MATPRVKRTSFSDSLTTRVVSKAIRNFTPGGKRLINRSSSAVTAFFTASALALGSWYTPRPTASRPLKRSRLE